jgi:very-short-patch-repair endonuclease
MREGQKRDIARELRHAMTDAERRLWHVIRLRQVSGCKFRRQCPIGPYVADFVCLERLLVVEVDGGQHCDSRTDPRRDAYLRRQGFRVLRFWNHDVLGNIAGVFQVIEAALAAPTPTPTLPRKRGRERS